MEKARITDLLNKLKDNNFLGYAKEEIAPWYNSHGDCIEFLTMDCAYLGDRVDDYLTIYRSTEDNKPIGFQLKDVSALIRRVGAEGVQCEARVAGTELVSVSALLLVAYETGSFTMARRQGYALATQAKQEVCDEVKIAAIA